MTDLHSDEALIDRETAIWTQEDNILVDKLTVVTHEKHTYILVVKQNVLIIFGINEEGILFDQKVEYVEEYYITGTYKLFIYIFSLEITFCYVLGIYHYKNIVLVLSLTGTLTQFTISGKRTNIVVTRKKIPIKADIQHYRTHGFFFSSNMVLCGILLFPKSLKHFSTTVILYLFNNSYLNPLEILWGNPTGSLRNVWDCFEILRYVF